MTAIKIIDPVTRIEGHLKIEVTVDTVNGVQQVTDAWATGTLFRGFEKILIGRHPADAQHITQRICGVCPVSHGLAAVLALESAYKAKPPSNARVLRNLVLGANFLQSHILHFYHLTLPDFVEGPDMPPWQPSWQVDKRFSSGESANLINNYLTALTLRRKAHEMGAIFGGRLPHPPTFLPGGITTTAKADDISAFKGYLTELVNFINGVYLPDVERLAAKYDDYFALGVGARNLLAFGVFDLNTKGSKKLLKRGRIINASSQVNTVNVTAIAEQVGYSWYADSTNNLNPGAGDTLPQYPKNEAYSWLKAPRYANLAYETGPLARLWVNGDYREGISVMDRHRARAAEALKVALAMQTWIKQVRTGKSNYKKKNVPSSAVAYGLTEAPRGALGHWLKISGGKLAGYQVITPTCWNASPRDNSGQRGPIEQALIGTPVANLDEPTEVVRVIHSFDPCLSCAVHVMRPAEGKRIFTLGHYGEKSCPVRESD